MNIHLLQRAMDDIGAGASCDAPMHAKAIAWLKHGQSTLMGSCQAALSGPSAPKDAKLQQDDDDGDDDDEHVTLDDLLRAHLQGEHLSRRAEQASERTPKRLLRHASRQPRDVTVTQPNRRVSRKRLCAFPGATLFASADSDDTQERERESLRERERGRGCGVVGGRPCRSPSRGRRSLRWRTSRRAGCGVARPAD